MFFKDVEKEYKLVAPDVDELISFCDIGTAHEVLSTPTILGAIEPLFEILNPLAPIRRNDAIKEIWIRVPRGAIEDYDDFERLKSIGEVSDFDDFYRQWLRDYPDEYKWYRLIAVRYYETNGKLHCYGMNLNEETVISAVLKWRSFNEPEYFEEKAFEKLCKLITPAVMESIKLLQDDKYNDLIAKELPYRYRKGVIKRSDLWIANPEYKEEVYRGISDEMISRLKGIIASGENDEDRIGRIRDFTANDFFRACKIGYEAIGYKCKGFSMSELYIQYSDRRDEGLTGRGVNPYDEPGIDFDDPKAWDEWYFHRKQRDSGHPFEVAPGYYHLYVWQDKTESETGGYYFNLSGSHWCRREVISAYLAIKDAGFPISLSGAEMFVDSLEGADYIGIVPVHMSEYEFIDQLPEEFGYIDDCIYADGVKDGWLDKIIWFAEEPEELLQ